MRRDSRTETRVALEVERSRPPDRRLLAEILRFQSRLYMDRVRRIGGPRAAALVQLIVLGELEGRPLDITSLAHGAMISRQQAARYVEALAKAGYAAERKTATRRMVLATPKLMGVCLPMARALAYQYRRLAEVLARIEPDLKAPPVTPDEALQVLWKKTEAE